MSIAFHMCSKSAPASGRRIRNPNPAAPGQTHRTGRPSEGDFPLSAHPTAATRTSPAFASSLRYSGRLYQVGELPDPTACSADSLRGIPGNPVLSLSLPSVRGLPLWLPLHERIASPASAVYRARKLGIRPCWPGVLGSVPGWRWQVDETRPGAFRGAPECRPGARHARPVSLVPRAHRRMA